MSGLGRSGNAGPLRASVGDTCEVSSGMVTAESFEGKGGTSASAGGTLCSLLAGRAGTDGTA